MPQKTHTMHGRDHEPHGADPIRGLLPAPGVDIADRILALGPSAFWKLNETSGVIAHDSSGNLHHLEATGSYTAPTWGQTAGPPGDQTALWPDSVETRVSSNGGAPLSAFTDDFTAGVWIKVLAGGETATGGGGEIMGQGLAFHSGDGWSIMAVSYLFAVVVDGNVSYANNPIAEDTWYFVATVRDAGTWKLYVDGLLQASTFTHSPGTGYGDNTWLGNDSAAAHSEWLQGALLSYAFIVDRPMTSTELLEIAEGSSDEGEVPTIDEDGNVVWAPPGTEVEHGDGDPDEDPRDVYIADPGDVNENGWHLNGHHEYVVLYDSSPGRFDVPPRKWTRVPFNTVRIYRTWEHPDHTYSSAWLTDDRGLTEHAKQGLLFITPGMAFALGEGTITGWFSIEYPVADATRMPGYGTVHGAAYMRAARMTNVTHGRVLRVGTGWGNYRQFFQWPFTAADGDEANPIGYLADNPYPVYLPWAARPLNKPLPYPKLTNAQSLTRYQTPSVHEPGFRLNQLHSDAALAAGDAISVQAWQDTPWTLRFGTDKYPPYTQPDLVQEFRERPCLVLSHYYDPDTVDHDTGALI